MSFPIEHCVHQRTHGFPNKVAALYHHSQHPTPIIVSLPQTPTLSKDHRGSRLTNSHIQWRIQNPKSVDANYKK